MHISNRVPYNSSQGSVHLLQYMIILLLPRKTTCVGISLQIDIWHLPHFSRPAIEPLLIFLSVFCQVIYVF